MAGDFDKVFAVGIALIISPFFLWPLIKGLRTGESGPREGAPGLPAHRASEPGRYWLFITIYAAAIMMFMSFAAFMVTYTAGVPSVFTKDSMIVAILAWSVMFGAIAGVTASYTVAGFRTGRSVFLGGIGVNSSERTQRPRAFWVDQIANIATTTFCGVLCLGSLAVVILLLG